MNKQQLPLSLRLDSEASFDNFYQVAEHQLPLAALRAQALGHGDKWLYLHGAAGRSHLLQASCLLAESSARFCRYIPLRELSDYDPEALLESSEELDLLCLDDIDVVVGQPHWEQSLFNCYNRLLARRGAMLVSSRFALSQLSFQLPDLRSRLQGFSVYQLAGLDDQQRIAAFQFRARLRGLVVSDTLGEYIYARCQRDLDGLFAVLNTLDSVSLIEKRRLTIPFVKQVMAW